VGEHPLGRGAVHLVQHADHELVILRGSVQIGAGSGDGTYDITVVGPNRFLRRFTGDVNARA